MEEAQTTGNGERVEELKGDLDRISEIKWRVGGTPFQRKVWNALPKIRSGSTISYCALAAKLGVDAGAVMATSKSSTE